MKASIFRHRMGMWLVVSIVLAVVAFGLSPSLLGVTVYKLNLLSIAAWLGYWIDRSLFPYARPSELLADGDETIFADQTDPPLVVAASFLRRAIIVGACLIAFSLAA